MKKLIEILILAILISGCSEKEESGDRQSKQFSSEIIELRDYFKIPGLAVSIDNDGEIIYRDYFGFSDIENSTELKWPTCHIFNVVCISLKKK
ncbi:hypothetical protein [Aquimarina sp. SS2-1]|uniref:hypothetical protein n=1 Tax=Aquimarina besae TaxID=3342247 RepID=UPI00366B4263